MTQTEIGKLVGKGQTTVSKWRLGQSLPELSTAIELALKANLCVEWLLTERGPKHPDALIDDPALADVVRYWHTVGPMERDEILKHARYIRTTYHPDPRRQAEDERVIQERAADYRAKFER